jgi:coenzyme F420-reducing hydrogenase alpha subunit
MGIEGRLTIELERAADGAGRASISSSRPLGLTKAFIGRSAHETVQTLPILFSVCGLAQGAAAAQACERALGIKSSDETQAVRGLLVLAETLREHLIRAVMDWPRFLGLDVNKGDLLRVMRLSEDLKRALDPEGRALTIGGSARLARARIAPAVGDLARLVETLVLGEARDIWQARQSAGDFRSWSLPAATPSQRLVRAVLDRGWAGAGRAATRFLPRLDDRDLGACLLGDAAAAFVAAPTWDGMPHETSALARQADRHLVRDVARNYGSNGLLARIAARLIEVAELPGIMRRIAESCSDVADGPPAAPAEPQQRSGRGLAQVEAARGRLVHGVEIEDGIVRRYAILAPTEWNFHSDGGAALGLADIAGRERDAREIADLFVTTVDPCVGYELRVH